MRVVLGLILGALVALAGCARSPGGAGVLPAVEGTQQGRQALTTLYLSEEGPATGHAVARFQAVQAARVTVAFAVLSRGEMAVQARCDGRARGRVHPQDVAAVGETPPAWVPAGTAVTLRLGPAARLGPVLDLHPEVARCDLVVTPGGRAPWSLTVTRDDDEGPHGCAVTAGDNRLARVFAGAASPGLSMSCPVPVGPVRMVPDGLDALNARIEALTGRAVDPEVLRAGDPEMALDWSNAPDLDLITITTLNLNADFAGYLTARMLAWHAARGTPVRVLVSDVMLTDLDRALIEGLAARYPLVAVQSYRLPPGPWPGLEGQVARVHSVNHVKLFAVLAREPGRSRAILGGRNLHEGYFFDAPHDVSALPFLHRYDLAQTRLTGGFTAYDDTEAVFSGDAAVAGIMAHVGALWHRDADTMVLSSVGPLERAAPEGMRHFLSVPQADGRAQEALFVAMIDAAQHRIRIASPYLTLTPALADAFERARARGVAVDVVLTVRVREALEFAITGFNRRFINRFGDWARVYDHDRFPALLHAKLYVIDDRLVVITSTNLNARSFVHDLENGVIALDRGLAAQVDAQIQAYIDTGARVRPVQPIPRVLRWMERIGMVERWF